MVRVEKVDSRIAVMIFDELRTCWLIRDEKNALIESGLPADAEDLAAGLAKSGLAPRDIHFLALTHIHVDHAGGAGYLAKENPGLQIFVHPQGAKHLINPARLMGSVKSAYGESFSEIGAMLEIPSHNTVVPVSTGDLIGLGDTQLEVYDTPGHAKHHIVFFDRTSGSVFAGDALGSKYNDFPNFVLSPPADYDKKSAQASIDLVRTLNPRTIHFTHCGPYQLDGTGDFYEDLKAKHDLWNQCVLEIVREHPKMTAEDIFEKFLEKIPELKNFPTQFFSFRLSVKGILIYLKKSGMI